MIDYIVSAIATRNVRKEIHRAEPPKRHGFAMPKTSMFHGNDIWHLVARFRDRDEQPRLPVSWLGKLVQTKVVGQIPFTITQLDGLNANNSDYGHIREFALQNFQHDYDGGRNIRFATDADFEENIACFNNSIGQPAHVTWCEWSGRFYLRNGGRGHHTAALYRQCLDQRRTFSFKANLDQECLDQATIKRLDPYTLLLCENNTAGKISDWSTKLDPDKPWVYYDFPNGWREFCDPATSMIAIPKCSSILPDIMIWLDKAPGAYVEFSSLLNNYKPAKLTLPELSLS